ncbi:hypothetical protein [Microbacterium maritypicum]
MSRSEGFAAVPTWMIRDAEVSIYAITVYASLSSRAGLREIIPGQQTLAREARCSERQVRRALIELEELGVVSRVRRKSRTGRAPDGYTLHPNGRTEVPDSQSVTSEVPDSEDGGTGLREQGFRTVSAVRSSLIGRDSEVEKEEVENAPSFDVFWTVWPRKDAKKAAEAAWSNAVKKHPAEQIIFAAAAYAQSPHRPEKKFVPYASSWLNGERWNDPLPEADTSRRLSSVDMGRAAAELLAVENHPHLRALS